MNLSTYGYSLKSGSPLGTHKVWEKRQDGRPVVVASTHEGSNTIELTVRVQGFALSTPQFTPLDDVPGMEHKLVEASLLLPVVL